MCVSPKRDTTMFNNSFLSSKIMKTTQLSIAS